MPAHEPGPSMSSIHFMPAAAEVLVTIAIPSFNRAAWLQDCPLSALGQTHQNFEVLVSDNRYSLNQSPTGLAASSELAQVSSGGI